MIIARTTAATVLFAALLSASGAEAASKLLDAATRATALHAIEQRIEQTYVFPKLRAPLVERLEQAERAHRYDGDNADAFAQHVTEDLQAVAHDGHLYLDHDPAEYAAKLAPPKSDTGMDAYYRAVAIRSNSGLTELKILPGNLRYLKLTAFHWTAKLTPRAYDDAGRFLKDGDAIIVDLRGNGGGDSDAADYFAKAFVKPNKGKPIYLLVDGHVASAAEAVPYGLQQEHAATIVGSTTYGAANNNKKFPIPPGFVLSVSYNRPLNPISHSNWEGTGVIPDIQVPGSEALEAAELDALKRLSDRPGASKERLAEYKWARIAVEAALHPVAVPRATLARDAGRYGPITLTLAADGLHLSRTDRPRWQKALLLTPLDNDGLFSVASFDGLRVRIGADALDMLYGSEDSRDRFARSKP